MKYLYQCYHAGNKGQEVKSMVPYLDQSRSRFPCCWSSRRSSWAAFLTIRRPHCSRKTPLRCRSPSPGFGRRTTQTSCSLSRLHFPLHFFCSFLQNYSMATQDLTIEVEPTMMKQFCPFYVCYTPESQQLQVLRNTNSV